MRLTVEEINHIKIMHPDAAEWFEERLSAILADGLDIRSNWYYAYERTCKFYKVKPISNNIRLFEAA